MERSGLLPKGFSSKQISKALKNADLDREHWFVAYETVRHGFLKVCEPAVKNNPLYCDLLKNKVTFYRAALPRYASVVHPGGAPAWKVRAWVALLTGDRTALIEEAEGLPDASRIIALIQRDIERARYSIADDEALAELIDRFVPKIAGDEYYA